MIDPNNGSQQNLNQPIVSQAIVDTSNIKKNTLSWKKAFLLLGLSILCVFLVNLFITKQIGTVITYLDPFKNFDIKESANILLLPFVLVLEVLRNVFVGGMFLVAISFIIYYVGHNLIKLLPPLPTSNIVNILRTIGKTIIYILGSIFISIALGYVLYVVYIFLKFFIFHS